ncbi:manganese efflux pump MntP family protein [Methanobrevibacter oralis]|uniref:Putative manganese efflux pump MntP n=1 Tax=Methanobrevibacter oralis TaxID=66851 RepID=A0A166C8X0_METOA|nr:manganese efflux pump MntP family protein [Methanobrevibacter oralis]KZX14253.1 putative manganese efflux pump MntP [Methanobrevibacter oralis]
MTTNLLSIIVVAIALAMDAFSVSLTKGFSQKNLENKHILYYGLFFGGFQFMMPVFGFLCGNTISSLISSFSPIVGFILLLAIGLNMIRESLSGGEEISDEFSFKELTLLAIATSIDAFAVGITFALLNDPLLLSCFIIGIVAFIFGVCGIFIGRKVGDYFGDKFQIVGGIVLILIGVKILLGI